MRACSAVHARRVRTWLAGSPGWVSATLQGALFAIAMLAMNVVLDDDPWGRAALAAGVSGGLFAVFMWFVSARELRKSRDILAGMTAGQRGQVVRAAATGTPPATVELRVASAALARSRLADYEAHRTLCVFVFAAFAVLGLVGAIAGSPWYLLLTALFAAFGLWAVQYPTTLRRRLFALESAS